MSKVYLKNRETTDWIRYRDGMWIAYRKRLFLYWFNFLQEVDQSSDYQVDWSKYNGWGGSNVIQGQKFDMWWEERWKELFGLKERNSPQRFPFSTTRPKTESIRLCLLVWKFRNMKPETRQSTYRGKTKTIVLGNSIRVARAVYQYEFGISGEKKMRNSEDEFNAYHLNPDADNETQQTYTDGGETYTDIAMDVTGSKRQLLQSKIGGYLRKSKKIMKNVSTGVFP